VRGKRPAIQPGTWRSFLMAVDSGETIDGDHNALNGYEFTSHSTWLTPQKTLVDVTLNWKGYDSIMFSPVEIFDAATECWHGSFNFFLTKNYKKAGLIRAADQFESERIEFSSHLRKENYLLFQDQPFDIEAFG
jgi:hypothetical protein